jgi:ParB-like chromosome segregation protein Spo0J
MAAMMFIRTAKVKIDALKLPGDWKLRLADPRVQELADSFATVPLLQRPGIRKDREIIWGRDRLAACHLAGHGKIDVDIWECTDDELRVAELTENARRRAGNRDQLVAELVAELARQHRRDERESAEEAAENPMDAFEPGGGGGFSDRNKVLRSEEPTKAEKAAARKAAAKLLGTTPAAVKQAELRAKAVEEAAPAVEEPAAPGAAVAAALKEIDGLLVAAQKRITKLTQDEPELSVRFTPSFPKTRLQEAAAYLRDMSPASECAYCKGVPSEQPKCDPCKASGWLTRGQLKDVPAELRVTGEGAAIYVRGELVRTSALSVSAPTERPPMRAVPKPGRRGQRAVVVDDAGRETEVEIPREEG